MQRGKKKEKEPYLSSRIHKGGLVAVVCVLFLRETYVQEIEQVTQFLSYDTAVRSKSPPQPHGHRWELLMPPPLAA